MQLYLSGPFAALLVRRPRRCTGPCGALGRMQPYLCSPASTCFHHARFSFRFDSSCAECGNACVKLCMGVGTPQGRASTGQAQVSTSHDMCQDTLTLKGVWAVVSTSDVTTSDCESYLCWERAGSGSFALEGQEGEGRAQVDTPSAVAGLGSVTVVGRQGMLVSLRPAWYHVLTHSPIHKHPKAIRQYVGHHKAANAPHAHRGATR